MNPTKLAATGRTDRAKAAFEKGDFKACVKPTDCLVRRFLALLKQKHGAECLEGVAADAGPCVRVVWPWHDADSELAKPLVRAGIQLR
jgi:hypothetical protein